ncbi:MAG TPA: HAD family hydrolase [Candidatus Bathyarchaeia archaeon]|nr:HAD family hydrolase [Candidatus Bathyarchaeia archaeon]
MRQVNKIKVIVLDFDNCIVLDPTTRRGSEEVKDQAWCKVFTEYDPEELEKVIAEAQEQIKGGKGDRRDIVRLVCKHFGIPEEKIPTEIEYRCEAFNAIVQVGILQIGVSPENRQAIKILSGKMPVYINTATPKEQSLESLAALELGGFKDVYGRPGNKVENLKTIIERESIDPSKILYVGDSENDWQAAQAVGCRFIGVQTARNTAWQGKQQEFPVIHSLAEILELEAWETK